MTSSVFYGEGILYGSGSFYGTGIGGIDVPQDLQYYYTNVENRMVFHWEFYPSFIVPGLSTLDWDLELDTMPTFDSPDLVTYDRDSAIDFQDGNPTKGFEIDVASRIEKVEQTWYARVRTKNGSHHSLWSDFINLKIPQRYQEEAAENMLNALPDENVYNKDILTFNPGDRNTTLYSFLYMMYGEQFDVLLLENFLTKTDFFLRGGRDEALFDNFGFFFDFKKPIDMANIEYRRCLQKLFQAALVGGTILAIEKTVQGFTGVAPTISNVRDNINFIDVDSESDPLVNYLDPDDPPILISKSDAGFGVNIVINNPAAFNIDIDLITFLLKKIIPAHIKFAVIT